ncbi:MAG: transporter substrate-binding domain-containing protein [Janthinobacterium lividum]
MKRRTLLTITASGVTGALLPGAARAEGSAIDAIRARGRLRAGLSTFVPWAMRDKQGGLIGFEIDVGNRLAKDLGVTYEPVPTAWDGIIPALLAGTFDVIIGGMTITPARQASVDFTEPYSFTGVGMVANRKTAGGARGVEAFNRPDFTIVGRRGVAAVQVAQKLFPNATIRQFDDDAQALQELLNGRAQALVSSTPKPAFAALDNKDELYLPIDEPLADQKDAMAVRKGDTQTLAVLNDWIAARKADGWLRSRFAAWFETRDWRPLVAQG